MPQQVTLYKVLIASPGDVQNERAQIPSIILEWNQIVGRVYGVMLDPVKWETHSTPEMGERPQAIINRQLVETSDILIGVFWTRLGTPTGEAESGTAEEIEQFIQSKKPAMLYFSSVPISSDKVEHEQYKKLFEFKESCRRRGLCFDYDNTTEFGKKLFNHLTDTVDRLRKSEGVAVASETQTTHIESTSFLQTSRKMQAEQAEDFRRRRLDQIKSGETPVSLVEGPKTILHIIPASALNDTKIDLSSVSNRWHEIRQINGGTSNYRINLDGLVTFACGRTQIEGISYTQLFRSGAIESVDTIFLERRQIPSGNYEKELLSSIRRSITLQSSLDLQGPFYVFLSHIDVRGVIMATRDAFMYEPRAIDRDDLLLSEAVIERTDADIAKAMKTVFDELWNAAGWEGSANYKSGEWTGGRYDV